MKFLSTTIKVAVFAVIALILFTLAVSIFGVGSTKPKSSPLIGRQAPGFELERFGGGVVKLSDVKGKALLLNFWASWCIPCRQEAAELESAWLQYRQKDVMFLGVNIWDDPDEANRFIQKYGGLIPNAKDPKGHIAVDYGVSGVPETFFIDSEGKVIDKFSGPLTVAIIDYFMNRIFEAPRQSEEQPKTQSKAQVKQEQVKMESNQNYETPAQ